MSKINQLLAICLLVAVSNSLAQQDYDDYRQSPTRLNNPAEVKPTPIPILKQINKHNEDGSYTYGYEGADGSFKIETKLATGEVKGKYGYVDEDGKVRIVQYGADKYGFQPSGDGITVPPPSLVDETNGRDNLNYDYEEEQPQRQPIKSKTQYQKAAPRPQLNKPVYVEQRQQQIEPQYYDYEQEQQQQHQQQAPKPVQFRSKYQDAPQSPHQAPIDIVYAPQTRHQQRPVQHARQDSFFDDRQPQIFPEQAPVPVRQAQPTQLFTSAPKHAKQQVQYAPEPQQYVPQQPQQRSYAHPSQQGRSTSVLDQLSKDYALPSGGSPALHDISFGYNF